MVGFKAKAKDEAAFHQQKKDFIRLLKEGDKTKLANWLHHHPNFHLLDKNGLDITIELRVKLQPFRTKAEYKQPNVEHQKEKEKRQARLKAIREAPRPSLDNKGGKKK